MEGVAKANTELGDIKMKYYSEKLDKVFDTEAELTTAEEADAKAKAEKEEAKALVKKESEEVQEAFKARNAARRDYNEKLVASRKAYNEVLKKAKEEFESSLKESTEALNSAETEYDEKLRAFQKAHPEGYRICLKDGDNVVTLTSNPIEYSRSLSADLDDMLSMFSDLLRRW